MKGRKSIFWWTSCTFLASCQHLYLWAAASPTMWRLFGGSEVITEGTCQCSNCGLFSKGHVQEKEEEEMAWGSQPIVLFQVLDEGQFALECKMHHGSWQKVEGGGPWRYSPWKFQIWGNFVLGLYWFYRIKHMSVQLLLYCLEGSDRTKVH